MALEKKKILANAKKYFTTGVNYGFMNDEFTNFLGLSFVSAPASTSANMNNAFEGGLIDHSLRITKYALQINDLLPEQDASEVQLRVDKTSLIKVCLLHQIGKANLFVEQTSQWHKDQGKLYDFNDNLVSMSVGERSIYYALSNGVKFTEEEYQAILNYNKADSDKQAKYHSTPLAVILKQAIALAEIEEQFNAKFVKQIAE